MVQLWKDNNNAVEIFDHFYNCQNLNSEAHVSWFP